LALLEGRGASAVAPGSARFVVQVGAFADNDAARDARRQVERLGLKSYVQVAQTASGSRIRVRVGPYSSRAEADAASVKARAAGLDAVVLAL
ncbi:MAG: SPOR domain-containing protein, partial [Pseudomonadota bacterium]|nr:SPOR domain-containing protein [Pseudomonadota bacterium]